MVISTAYGTAKGQLVRAILFPKPSKYDFERKLYYFVANLGVYLILVCVVTIFWQAGRVSRQIVLLLHLSLILVSESLPRYRELLIIGTILVLSRFMKFSWYFSVSLCKVLK